GYETTASRPRRRWKSASGAITKVANAAPWALRQREQWQWDMNCGLPSTLHATAPQRQLPVLLGMPPPTPVRQVLQAAAGLPRDDREAIVGGIEEAQEGEERHATAVDVQVVGENGFAKPGLVGDETEEERLRDPHGHVRRGIGLAAVVVQPRVLQRQHERLADVGEDDVHDERLIRGALPVQAGRERVEEAIGRRVGEELHRETQVDDRRRRAMAQL